MKILASQIWITFLSATTAMASLPGHGSPQGFEYCEYNADPVRTHRPSNVVRAEEALEQAEEALERIQDEFDEADTCQLECRETVYRVIRLTVGERNLQDYLDYLGGSFECYGVANTSVRHYNMYAQVYGWDVIQEGASGINPKRMIAENPRVPDAGGGTITIAEPELGDPDPQPVRPERPVVPAPQHQQCTYMGPENTLDLSICEAARRAPNGLDNRGFSTCRRCLGPQNRYGRCLRRMARLEQELYEAQDLVEQKESELNAALASPSSGTTCTDCMQDTRNWWQRWGPTLAVTGIVGATGYFAYRQERNSYEHYRDVIHENNNRLGYPTEPREDLSGYRLAAHLVNGTPMILNTGLSTGAFGCAGSTMYGMGSILGGVLGGSQQGGANGYNTGVTGGLNGSITGGILNGGNAGNGTWGTGQPSGAQIDASIRAQQQAIAQQQAQLAALQQSQAYYQSRSAIEADAMARINALGQAPPAGAGVWAQGQGQGSVRGGNSFDPLNGDFWNSGLINGGVQVRGQIDTWGNAGYQQGGYQTGGYQGRGVQPLPGNGYRQPRSPGWPQDTRVPTRHQTSGGNVDRLPL